jgi:hypothetical protein
MGCVVKIQKGKNSIAISTNASNEQEFLAQLVKVFVRGDFEGRWTLTEAEERAYQGQHVKDINVGDLIHLGTERNLSLHLPAIIDICCKLRGYKANVTEHRVIVAGEFIPDDVVEAFSNYETVEV